MEPTTESVAEQQPDDVVEVFHNITGTEEELMNLCGGKVPQPGIIYGYVCIGIEQDPATGTFKAAFNLAPIAMVRQQPGSRIETPKRSGLIVAKH